jgi:hypothetical protein
VQRELARKRFLIMDVERNRRHPDPLKVRSVERLEPVNEFVRVGRRVLSE